MGAYLSAPVTDKISDDNVTETLRYGASSMQGWRVSQEVVAIFFVQTWLPPSPVTVTRAGSLPGISFIWPQVFILVCDVVSLNLWYMCGYLYISTVYMYSVTPKII